MLRGAAHEAAAVGIHSFAVVLNKSTDIDADRIWLAREFGAESVLGAVPFDPRIAATDRAGLSLLDAGQDDLVAPFRSIQRILTERFEPAGD